MNCPQCGSDSARRFSVLYEEGTSHGKSDGFSDNASYETDHVSQTSLAKRCSPPEEVEIGTITSILGLVFSTWAGFKIGNFVGGFWWGVAGFTISAICLVTVWHFLVGAKANAQYRLNYRAWEKSWFCMKCGNAFSS